MVFPNPFQLFFDSYDDVGEAPPLQLQCTDKIENRGI